MSIVVPPLYHWSPADRRELIRRDGLIPPTCGDHELTTCSERLDYVCLGTDPYRAWTISGGMNWTPPGLWDLWQIRLENERSVTLRLEDGEVWEWKVRQPIAPGQLWLIATRTESAATVEAAS